MDTWNDDDDTNRSFSVATENPKQSCTDMNSCAKWNVYSSVMRWNVVTKMKFDTSLLLFRAHLLLYVLTCTHQLVFFLRWNWWNSKMWWDSIFYEFFRTSVRWLYVELMNFTMRCPPIGENMNTSAHCPKYVELMNFPMRIHADWRNSIQVSAISMNITIWCENDLENGVQVCTE